VVAEEPELVYFLERKDFETFFSELKDVFGIGVKEKFRLVVSSFKPHRR